MKLGKNAIELLRKFAPALAAGLGGPVAGQAAQFVVNKLGGSSDTTPVELEKMILGATPEQLADLKRSDQKFELSMRRLDIDVYAIEVDDRKDARKLFGINMWPQIILSIMFIGGYFALIFMLFDGRVEIAPELRDVSNILLGVMTASIPQIMNFWFGSSHGSKNKTPQI